MQLSEYKDEYTERGLYALYNYLENRENNRVFSPLDRATNWRQYPTAWEAMEQYQPEDMPTIDEEGLDLLEIAEKTEALALEWLNDRTTVITFDGGIIIQNF